MKFKINLIKCYFTTSNISWQRKYLKIGAIDRWFEKNDKIIKLVKILKKLKQNYKHMNKFSRYIIYRIRWLKLFKTWFENNSIKF